MFVPVVQVGIMKVAMDQRLMAMGMAVRLSRRIAGGVGVLMVRVMHVTVLVGDRLVRVAMGVPLRHVNPHAKPHEHTDE